MNNEISVFDWQKLLKYGVICAACILYIALVGILEAFQVRNVIDDDRLVIPLGQSLLIVISLGLGYTASLNLAGGNIGKGVLAGLVVGIVGGIAASIFVMLIEPLSIREMFVNASPDLIETLTFGQESMVTGLLMLISGLIICGILGALLQLLPNIPRRMILAGLTAVLFIAMLQDFLTRIAGIEQMAEFLFGRKGLTLVGALAIFISFALLNGFWATQGTKIQVGYTNLPSTPQRAINGSLIAVGILFLLFIPQLTDSYITQILFLVGLYTIMGLGLNIELGWAGLLDLGFSGFFAIGAYTVAIMCSTGELGIYYIMNGESGAYPFWYALPIAVILSAISGVVLGIPVLRTRGDYLAIITLGLAEIIRILVKSNALKDILGGAQGVLNITKPQVGPSDITQTVFGMSYIDSTLNYIGLLVGTVGQSIFGITELIEPMHFYYMVLIGCFFFGFVAWRMQHARIGRNWMALREDEDVAEAMGINLIATKLLAFGVGAGFAGLSGAVFAAQLGSVFPDSFNLLVSINVVSLVIIGGIGSIPGVVVGAFVLVGLPELLREFAEFRMLIYGMLLVVMMLVKPEGFVPSEATKREMETDDDIELEPVAT